MATQASRIGPGRAARLIQQIRAKGHMTDDAIAGVLGVNPDRLARFTSGAEHIPLNLQARLALYVIAQLPALVREGNALRGQVAAAIEQQIRQSPELRTPISHRAEPDRAEPPR